MNKRQKNTLIWVGVVLSVIAIAIYGGLFSINVHNVYQISCVGSGTELSCSSAYPGAVPTGEVGGTFTMGFDQNVQKSLNSNFVNAWGIAVPTVKEFFNNAIGCGGGGSYNYYAITIKDSYSSIANLKSQSTIKADDGCPGQYYQYYFSKPFADSKFINQLVVVKGEIIRGEQQGYRAVTDSFTTSGLCNFDVNTCSVNMPSNAQDGDGLNVNSITIYLKYGGFPTDGSACIDSGVEKCDGKVLSTCEGNSFVSQGNVDGKCGYSAPVIITEPTITPPPTFTNIFSKIAEWFNSIWNFLTNPFTISGENAPLPGSTQTYKISLSTSIPDSVYSDGSYQVQYANWALVDSSNNIKNQGTWEVVNGSYNKNVTIVMPTDSNKYAILGIINQYDLVFNSTSKSWVTVKDAVVQKEAYNIQTGLPVPVVEAPSVGKFLDIINSIINWFKALFGI